MLKKLGLFSAGFVLGSGFTWALDESLIWEVRSKLGYPPFPDVDYLKQASTHADLSLPEKRKAFTTILKEKGPSPHLSLLISDFSKRAFLIRAEKDSEALTRREELELMEGLMRQHYPELFDGTSGREFVSSLNLKLYCDDHYRVPKFLKPMR